MSKTITKPTVVEVVIVLIVIAIVFCIAKPFVCSFNDTKYTVTITDKERTRSGNEKYLVFTEDAENNVRVFENSDNWLRGKWDSSDLQGELKIGNTYEITVVGYRVPLFSWYENIIKIRVIS